MPAIPMHIKISNNQTVSKAEGHCLSKLLNGHQLTVTSNNRLESTAWNWTTYETIQGSTSCNSVANVDFLHDDLHIFFWYLKCKPSSLALNHLRKQKKMGHFPEQKLKSQRGTCEGNHLNVHASSEWLWDVGVWDVSAIRLCAKPSATYHLHPQCARLQDNPSHSKPLWTLNCSIVQNHPGHISWRFECSSEMLLQHVIWEDFRWSCFLPLIERNCVWVNHIESQ